MIYSLSALFAHETTAGIDSARQFVVEHVVGRDVAVSKVHEMEPELCGSGMGCPRGCRMYRFVYFFEVFGMSFEDARLGLLGELEDPTGLIHIEDEDTGQNQWALR